MPLYTSSRATQRGIAPLIGLGAPEDLASDSHDGQWAAYISKSLLVLPECMGGSPDLPKRACGLGRSRRQSPFAHILPLQG